MSTHVIQGSQIDLLPKRAQFYPETITSAIQEKINNRAPLIFKPITVQEKDVRGEYTIFINGILPNGAKALLIIRDIKPNFEVEAPFSEDGQVMDAATLNENIKNLLLAEQVLPYSQEITWGKPLRFFQIDNIPYVKLAFSSLDARHKAIGILSRPNGDKTYILTGDDDDMYNRPDNLIYFQKLAREQKFSTTSWNLLCNYRIGYENVPGCDYCFEIRGISGLTRVPPEVEEVLKGKTWFRREPSIAMSWDIETYSHEMYNEVPKAEDKYDIFIIACVFYWQSEVKTALTKICLTTCESFCSPNIMGTAAGEDNYLVLCKNEREMMRAFIHVIGRMSPDFSLAFNGGSFDWPLCREKFRRYDLLGELYANVHCEPKQTKPNKTTKSIHDYGFKAENVKISADEKRKMIRANFWGWLDIDMLVVYKQLYPDKTVIVSQSLKFFLADNNLPSKEDLPYKILFKIYVFSCEVENIAREIAYWADKGNDIVIINELVDQMERLTKNNTFDDNLGAELTPEEIPARIAAVQPGIDKLGSILGTNAFIHLQPEYKGVPARPDMEIEGVLAQIRALFEIFGQARWLAGHLMGLACKYCWVDSASCQRLMEKRAIFDEKRRVSDMAHVTLYEAFYRANGMKVLNFVAGKAHDVGIRMPMRKDRDAPSVTYPGAHVFYPRKRGIIREKPVTALDFSSLYPSIMMAYNLSPEKSIDMKYPWAPAMIERLTKMGYDLHYGKFMATLGTKTEKKGEFEVSGYTVRHNMILKAGDKPLDRARNPLPGEDMGIFPTILKDLFDLRASIKKIFEKYKLHIELIISGKSASIEEMIKDGIDPAIAGNLEEMEFQYKKMDSEQKAVKVYMNTFYGVQGSSKSAINFVIIAGFITMLGQYNIKMVAKMLEEWGYEVIYGDTDSNYLQCPDSTLEPIKKAYERLVEILK